MSQELPADDGVHREAAGKGQMEGQTQMRGADPAGEKCRITFEARQAVSGFFQGHSGEDVPGDRPRSHILPSILVVKGGYARLDNIAADHTFVKDEVFWLGEKKVERKAGQKTGGSTCGLGEQLLAASSSKMHRT